MITEQPMKKGIYCNEEEMGLRSFELLHVIRNEITRARGKLHDFKYHHGWKDRVDSSEGGLTLVISSLYHVIAELERHSREGREAIRFNSRGIGMDQCPGCFVCVGGPKLLSNISGFVASKEDGERLVSFFKSGARMDFRSHEPNRIQVKIGACESHTENLRELNRSTSDGGMSLSDIQCAQGIPVPEASNKEGAR